MNLMSRRWLLVLASVIPCAAIGAQSEPPIRPLGPIVAKSSTPFGVVSQIVSLSSGRILVADAATRRVVMFDTSLAKATTVLDSTAGKQNSFSPRSFLLPFRGDSSLFYDDASGAFVVLGPDGALGRVMASPLARQGSPFASPLTGSGMPAASPVLGLLYRAGSLGSQMVRPAPGEPDAVRRLFDSSLVLRMNFTTRAVDTLAKISTGRKSVTTMAATGGSTGSIGDAVFPFFDEMVVTTDGSLAIFHAQEYRIEWMGADGTRSAGSRLPFPWRRVTDQDRSRILDSVNTRQTFRYDSTMAARAADSTRTGAVPTITVFSVNSDGERSQRQAPAPVPRRPILALPDEVPDFFPPTSRDAVMADGDNNVWIRPQSSEPAPAGTVWDVVNRKGELIDRVRIPDGHTLAGFAPGGVVYLIARDAGVATLEKARFR